MWSQDHISFPKTSRTIDLVFNIILPSIWQGRLWASMECITWNEWTKYACEHGKDEGSSHMQEAISILHNTILTNWACQTIAHIKIVQPYNYVQQYHACNTIAWVQNWLMAWDTIDVGNGVKMCATIIAVYVYIQTVTDNDCIYVLQNNMC